jgi:peptidyl-prolyl cis-trans isomerase SurA
MQLSAKTPLKRLVAGLAVAVTLALPMMSAGAQAQGLFSPAITVNSDVITRYELEQRARFLAVLRAPGNPETAARDALIEDRLKLRAAAEAGIVATPEEIEIGMEEFAQRVNLSTQDFINGLEEAGIAPETFRAFAESGVVWREFVRTRFLGQARPTEAEIDRALGGSTTGASGIRVLLSEIIIPITQQTAQAVLTEADRISRIDSISAFAAEAARFSAAETRNNGGRLDWIEVSQLPPNLQTIILELAPGQVTSPLPFEGAVALFQLRDIAEAPVRAPRYAAIDFATYLIPGGRTPEALARAAEVRARVATCDDLYGIAKGQPENVLERQSLAPSAIPRDIALELAKLDDNEVSTTLTRANGQTLVFLMLCGRTSEIAENASREDVANALTQQRLNSLADGYLQRLRAEAEIIER